MRLLHQGERDVPVPGVAKRLFIGGYRDRGDVLQHDLVELAKLQGEVDLCVHEC